MNVAEIAGLLGAPFDGDGGREISGGAAPEQATAEQIAFIESKAAAKAAEASQAGCLIVAANAEGLSGRTLIRVPAPRNAFARVLRELHPPQRPAAGVHRTALVAESARVAKGAWIGPHAVVGETAEIGANTIVHAGAVIGDGARLGRDCLPHPGATVYPSVHVGDRAILHAGSVLGADGFGYVFEGGRYEKFPQMGGLRIGDDFEIGANACVDRGALGDTVIGDGVKLDNMVHVGHNCRLGNHVVIAAQTGLSGGVVVDDYVVMGGQVGISEKAHIETRAVLGAQAGILPYKTLEAGQTFRGTPARIHREHLKKLALVERLPKILAELAELRQKVAELEGK